MNLIKIGNGSYWGSFSKKKKKGGFRLPSKKKLIKGLKLFSQKGGGQGGVFGNLLPFFYFFGIW